MIYINAAIAAGKSSLTKYLSEDLGTKAFYEEVDDMPMLKKFYAHSAKSRYELAFPLQVAFLNYRYTQLSEGIQLAREGMRNTVYDSSLLSDSLMANNLHRRHEFPTEEYNLYLNLLKHMQANVGGHPFNGYPDLVVYLDMSFSTILKHIQERGRDIEDITKDQSLVDYYRSVWDIYNNWAHSYSESSLLVIDMNKYDFVHRISDRAIVLALIERRLYDLGLLKQVELKRLIKRRKNDEIKHGTPRILMSEIHKAVEILEHGVPDVANQVHQYNKEDQPDTFTAQAIMV